MAIANIVTRVYTQFLKEMIIQPGIAKANMGLSREDVTMEDHPLNPNPDSRWNNYFKDNEILLQIDKDRPTQYPCQLILDPQNDYETLRRRVEQTTLKSQTVLPSGSEAHWEVVERILFIYAKLNPGIAYVQGMNENRDNFIKSLDDSQCGITYKMESVYSMLRERDLELYLKLEFLLPDVIRIWDTLFSDQDRFHLLILDYPISDVNTILIKAKDLRDTS
ncbi:hypothetical protein F7725_015077 [Dissostichus mawsoni]|uniref:Rab-GAP TBC domain-containing protein n=1 Tax=Dissostichus mawsoni TaxID=36200 RepID=A0A7J5YGR9_DISMA|nr:hypothetical protein F7725_015077 [Dissostichus mawsoni]